MIKKLMKSIREYKTATILTPVFVALEVVLEVAIPLIMANLIDDGIYGGDMNVVYKIGLELILCAVLSLIFGALSGKYAAKASSGFARNLRKDLYYKVQEYSFSNIDKFSTSSLVTRLTTDVTNVQMAFQMIIRVAVRAPLMIAISLFFSISISAKLSLIFLVLIPILGIGLYLIIRNVHPIMKRVFRTYDNLNNVVEENVAGIRVVKSFVIEEKEKKKFEKVSNSIYQDFSKAEKILALNNPLMQFSIYVCILAISWFGAQIIVNTGMTEFTTGELMTMFTYTIQILSSLMMLSMILVMITISKSSAERIVEVLEETPDIQNKKEPITEVKDGSVEFKDVSFSYVNDKDKECLKDINLKINSGETIGIIGSTGSGKSSLVNLIPRLYDVTEGELLVGGKNVKEYDIESLRDDSTSAVDTKTDSLIRKAFREEIPDVTKIIIAQRISSVEDCDKIIVMEDGKINGVGTHEELLKSNNIYREVYESQVKGSE